MKSAAVRHWNWIQEKMLGFVVFVYFWVYSYVCLFKSKQARSVIGSIEPSKGLIKYRMFESKLVY
jgi:hypothetical protein